MRTPIHLRHWILSAVIILTGVPHVWAADGEAVPAERYERRVQFGPVLLGESKQQTARVELRPGSKDDPFFISQHPDPPFSIEKGQGRRGDTVFVDNDRVELDIVFTPTRPGEWRDSVVLVRFDPFDRIVLYVYGVGVSASRNITLDYGSILTGDTVVRAAIVPDPRRSGQRVSWRLVGKIDAPFRVLNPKTPMPIQPGSDTMGFVFAYMPTEASQHATTVGIVRVWDDEVPLDTIVCKLAGIGKRMQAQQQVRADDVFVGEVDTIDVATTLPVMPRHAYGYRLEPRGQGPVVGRITEPVTPSYMTRILSEFRCTPTQVGTYERTFALLRYNGGSTPVDSTIITVTGLAKERPAPKITVRVGFDAETTAASIGDTVRLPILLDLASDRPIQGMATDAVRAIVSYNPTVLVPIPVADVRVVDREAIGDTAGVTFEIDPEVARILQDRDTLITLPFVVVVGDDDRSAVRIHTMSVTRAQNEPIELRDSALFTRRTMTVTVDDVWQHQSGQRRVNTLQGTLDVVVEPNPLESQAVMRVVNVPVDIGTFTIVDPVGRVMADLSQSVRAGTTTFTISTSAGADVTLLPGSYYARLLVRGADGHAIYSVARLIVVR